MNIPLVLSISAITIVCFVLVELAFEETRSRSRGFIIAILLLILTAEIGGIIQHGTDNNLDAVMNRLPSRHWVFLIGPLLLVYQKSYTERRMRPAALLHLVPVIVWCCIYPAVTPAPHTLFARVYGSTSLVSLITYSIIVIINIRSYARRNLESYSYVDLFIDMRWLEAIVLTLLGITLLTGGIQGWDRISSAPPLPGTSPPVSHSETTQLIHSLAILAFTFFFSLFAIRQDRATGIKREKASAPKADGPCGIGSDGGASGKEDLSGKEDAVPIDDGEEDDETIAAAYTDLRKFMDEREPFADPHLTLDGLASDFGIGRNDLSRIINRKTTGNFFHFINGYRARAFRTAMRENLYPEYTLLAVAMECGFNSKSTFNAAVKKEFGMTPSQLSRETGPESSY